MKKCIEIKDLLSLYLDNELHENERKQVVKHIEVCVDCKRELENLKNIVDSVGDLEEVELPVDYNEKLHEKLIDATKNIKSEKWRHRTKILKWASGIAAGFIIFIFAFNINSFDNFMNKSKVAYVNDAKLQLAESLPKENVLPKEKVASNTNHGKIYDIDIATFNDKESTKKEMQKTIAPEDKAIKNIESPAQSIQKTQIPNNDIDNIQLANDNKISIASMMVSDSDLKNKNNTLNSNVKNNDNSLSPQMIENLKPEVIVQRDVNLSILVQSASDASSKLISIVQSLGGNIEEITLLKSLKEPQASVERHFTINISNKDFNKIVETLKDYGIIVENSFESTEIESNINIHVRIIEREFMKKR